MSARAANVHHVLTPLIDPTAVGRRRRHLEAGHVRAEVGLGDGDRDHGLRRCDPGQPVLLLLLGAPFDQRPGQDLGPGDQRAARAQRATGELLGGDHHAQVIALAPRREAAVLLGHRQPESAHVGQTRDDLFGDVPVGAVDVLGHGPDALLGEAPERVGDHLEVAVEVTRTVEAGQAGQERRVAVAGHEGERLGQRTRRRPPPRLPAQHLGRGVPHRVGDEGAGDAGLDVALGPVVERGPGRLDRGRGVGQVVGDDLVGLHCLTGALAGQVAGGAVDHRPGQGDGGCGGVEVSVGHAERVPTGTRRVDTSPPAAQHVHVGRRATTVTRGGSTIGSSPGSTSVRARR